MDVVWRLLWKDPDEDQEHIGGEQDPAPDPTDAIASAEPRARASGRKSRPARMHAASKALGAGAAGFPWSLTAFSVME